MPKYKECPHCGEVLNYKATKCNKCGKELSLHKKKNLTPELKSKLKRVTFWTLWLFILFNFVFFFKINSRVFKEESMNKEARAYLYSAAGINAAYIFPLSKAFGFDNPLTCPFYAIRETLYKKGLSELKPDDGEREVWWCLVKFSEFHKLYLNEMFDWRPKEDVPPKWIADKLIQKEDEVFNHIKLYSKAKIQDKNMAKDKYLTFIQLSYDYTLYFSYLSYQYKEDFGIDYSDKTIKRFIELYNVYKDYKKYAQKNEIDDFKNFNSNKSYKSREEAFKSELLKNLLKELYKKDNYRCDYLYIKDLNESQNKVLDRIEKYRNSISFDELNMLYGATTPFYLSDEKKKKCMCSKSFIEYSKYEKRRMKVL